MEIIFKKKEQHKFYIRIKNFEQKNVTFDVGVGKKQQKNVRVQDLEKEFGILAELEKTRGQKRENAYI